MAGGSTFTWQHALLLHSTKSPFDSPLPQTHQAFAGVQPVSWERRNIGGLLVTIYGQRELPPSASSVACLWLLHGRGDTQDSMGFCAAALLNAWNGFRGEREQQQQQQQQTSSSPGATAAAAAAVDRGLIVVCFDQRNHGSRMVENLHNLSWKQGNQSHGMDMFNCYVGTARDLSLLVTQLPAYLPFAVARHLCGGVSLGGHATWVALMADPRIEAGLVVVGCPDYVRLMRNRAIRSERASAADGGKGFVGSDDFPPGLVEAVREFDPAGILTGVSTEAELAAGMSEADIEGSRTVVERTLKGKTILCLSGEKDKLVPYAQGAPFMAWLKRGVDVNDGWAGDMGVSLEHVIDPDGRHEFSAPMRKEAERWLCELLSDDKRQSASKRESKM